MTQFIAKMDYVKVAEELPNLVAEVLFSHIRKHSDTKAMTVTGKLSIDLVQVILEVSLNHSLQLAAAKDTSANDSEADAVSEGPQIADTYSQSEEGVMGNIGSDNTVNDTKSDEVPEEERSQTATNAESVSPKKDAAKASGDDSCDDSHNDQPKKKSPAEKSVLSMTPKKSAAKEPEDKHDQRSQTGNSLDEKASQTENSLDEKASQTESILDEDVEKSKRLIKMERNMIIKLSRVNASKSVARQEESTAKENIENGGDLEEKTSKSGRKLRNTANDTKPGTPANKKIQQSSQSPMKRTKDGSPTTPTSAPTKKLKNIETEDLSNRTRSGRKIVKPKRIWNPDMAAEDVAITPRPSTSKETQNKPNKTPEEGFTNNVDDDEEPFIKTEVWGDSEDEDWHPTQPYSTDLDEVSENETKSPEDSESIEKMPKAVKKQKKTSKSDSAENAPEAENNETKSYSDSTKNAPKAAKKKKRQIYNCDLCTASYKTNWQIKCHYTIAHQKKLQEPRIYSCEHCKKTFKRRQNLQEHMFIHDKNTNYKCETCVKTFATKGKLNLHMKTWHSAIADPDKAKRRQTVNDSAAAIRLEPESRQLISEAHCHGCDRLLETYLRPHTEIICPNCKADIIPPPLEGAEVLPAVGNEQQLFCCTFCKGEKFTGTDTGLRNHMYESHSELLTNPCPFCNFKFVLSETLNIHLLQQHPNRAYKKKPAAAATDANDGQEENSVFAKFRKMYYCAPCEKIYHTRTRLHDHIIVVHEEKQLPYLCTTCDKSFVHKDLLAQHIKFNHESEWFRICDKCGKFFRKKVDFDNHRHEDDPRKCDQCDATFTSYSGYRMHKKKHKELPTLMCKYCGAMFHYQSYLKNHERLHTGEKPYECSVCNHKFSNMYVFNKHKKRHFDKKHKCPSCPRTFMYPSDLRSHVETHSSDRLRYACTLCDNSYVKMSSLRSHVKAKHGYDTVEVSMERVETELADAAHGGFTLFSCVTCNSCFYSEEECMKCQMSHEETPVAVTVLHQ